MSMMVHPSIRMMVMPMSPKLLFVLSALLVLLVIVALLTKARVRQMAVRLRTGSLTLPLGSNGDMSSIVETQREQIAMDEQLHRVAHRCKLDERNLGARNDTHVEKMLTQGTLTPHVGDQCSLASM